jgi:hypothetical protein
MYKNKVTSDMKLRYSMVITPYRCRVHSVRTKPSGHRRRMMGPRYPKISMGREDARAYTNIPCTPEMVANSGYEKRIPEPRAIRVSCHSIVVRGAGMELERQHFSHASINLIEYLRYNLSFAVARQDLPRKTHTLPQQASVPRLDPNATSTQRP